MDFRYIKIISFMLLVMFSISSVFALGVSAPYWGDDHPLKLNPGGSKTVEFTLVTKAETEDAVVTMVDDAGIAEIISGSEYSVLPKQDFTPW